MMVWENCNYLFLKNTVMKENSCSEQIVPESLLELLKPVS